MHEFPATTAKSHRKHLTETEMECVFQAAGEGRWKARDRAICALLYYHGLRVSELCGLLMSDLDMDSGHLYARRLKRSRSTIHPIGSIALRALRRYLQTRPKSPFPEVFLSERGEPFSRKGIAYLTGTWGKRACIPFQVYPHMLRHSCGYALVNRPGGSKDLLLVRDYLGHKSIQSTMEYVSLAPGRFEDLWGN